MTNDAERNTTSDLTRRASAVWTCVRPGLGWAWRHLGDLLVIVFVVVGFLIGYGLSGGGDRSDNVDTDESATGAADTATQMYTCSMHPEVRLPNPDDKCPICFMDLIPVSADSGGATLAANQVRLSEQAQALIDVETTPVVRRFIDHTVRMVGEIDYDETKLAYITAYVGGRLDRLFVDYTGIDVRKGDHLAEIYSPELLVARQELLAAKRAMDRLGPDAGEIVTDSARSVLAAARERLRLLGLKEKQIAAIESGEMTGDRITLFSPIGGVVISKNAKQGSYVKEGDRIYTIADLSNVWVMIEAYESDLPWLRYGQTVRFTTEAFGDEEFAGKIVFISPTLDPGRRTARVRVNVNNEDGRLRPGMFVRSQIDAEVAAGGRVISPELAGKWISPMHPEVVRDEPGDCPVCGMDLVKAEDLGYTPVTESQAVAPLVVPVSAVLRTGRRGIVFVKTESDDGAVFEMRQVALGPRGDGFFIITAGLREGELVASRGAFQIDSALQIQAKQSMMNPGDAAPPEPVAHLHGDAARPIAKLIDAYLGWSAALASDDAAASLEAAGTFVSAYEAAADAEYPAMFDQVWRGHADHLAAAIQRLREAEDIAAMRQAFHPVSNVLIDVARRSHITGVGPLWRAHCPMAFDNAGASWLTDEEKIVNPYWGARMLRCGSIEEQLAHTDKHATLTRQPTEKPATQSANTPSHDHE